MSNKPVLCIQVNEETQLRLLEERHVEEYFALIERNQEHLHEWIAVEAYEGSVETLRAYVKQRLLQFVNGEGYHLGIWYQDALVGLVDYRLNGRSRSALNRTRQKRIGRCIPARRLKPLPCPCLYIP